MENTGEDKTQAGTSQTAYKTHDKAEMGNSDGKKQAKCEEYGSSQEQPKPVPACSFSQVREKRKHFGVPSLQNNKHDQRECKHDVSDYKGVW